MLGKGPGVDDVPDAHRRHHPVGHLDAHHGAFVGDGRNAHAAAAQGQGNIVGQVGELGQLHPPGPG